MFTRNNWIEVISTPSIDTCHAIRRFYNGLRSDVLKHMGYKSQSCFLDKVKKFNKHLQLKNFSKFFRELTI